MFEMFRNKRIAKYTTNASEYLERIFTASLSDDVKLHDEKPFQTDDICYSLRDDGIMFSDRRPVDSPISLSDKYDSLAVARLFKNYNLSTSSNLLKNLEDTTNKTFVETLMFHIHRKGMRDTEVYKLAQIDRRLFSKIMSDKEYKPAKDTAIALAIALSLTLDETNDLLSRAGYALSHSSKRDIIVEYFLREQIYKLDDINQVLLNLNQKIIGR
jgi:hypothetical protein